MPRAASSLSTSSLLPLADATRARAVSSCSCAWCSIERRELQRLADVVGLDVGRVRSAAAHRRRRSAPARSLADRRLRGGAPCVALFAREPFLADAEALHRHRLARRAEAVRAGDRKVFHADAQHRVGQLGGSSCGFGRARHARACGARRFRALHCEVDRGGQRERRCAERIGQRACDQDRREKDEVDHALSKTTPRMPASGRAAPAPISTESSDAQSEGLEKDGVGRWTRFAADRRMPRPRRAPRRESTGTTSICTIAGRLGAATFAISNDCAASVAC